MNGLVHFILTDAQIPGVTLDEQALRVRNELAFALQPLGVPPLEGIEFATWVLQSLCQDGTPTGIALRPALMDAARKRRPGLARYIRQGAILPPRIIRSEQILCTITRCLAKETTRRDPTLKTDLSFIEQVLTVWTGELDRLAQRPDFVLLQQRPRAVHNRVLELHLETCGYPAYGPFGVPMHLGLIARIEQQSDMPPHKRQHNLRTYLTAPKAIIPIVPIELVRPTLADYGAPDQLGSLLFQVVQTLVGIKEATRLDYVIKFLHLVYGRACDRAAIERVGGRLMRTLQPSRLVSPEAEQDPEGHLELSSHADWLRASHSAAQESEVPTLPLSEVVLDSPDAETEALSAIELPHQTERQMRRLTRFARHRLVQDRLLDEAAPGVLSLDELVIYWACVHSQSDECELDRTAQRVFLELLLGVGQPAEHLARVTVGKRPETPLRCSSPVYDPVRGSLSFAPRCYVYVPDRLQPPPRGVSADAEAIRRWRDDWQDQQVAYVPTTLVHEVCLPPPLRAAIERLREVRGQALHEFRRGESTDPCPDSGPLFLLVKNGCLGVWSDEDTRALIARLNTFARRWHPDWPPLRVSQFQRTAFVRYVARYGLDPVYAWYVTDYPLDFLEMPLRYSLVCGTNLTRAYWNAFRAFQADLVNLYRMVWEERLPLSTPLSEQDWLDDNAADDDLCFGTPHHPQPESLARLTQGLIEMCNDEDARVAHNARVTLVLLLLTVCAGVRPSEEMDMLDEWIDVDDGSFSVRGKSNFDHEAYRRLALPGAVMPLLTHVRRQSRCLARGVGWQPAFWMFERDRPVPARSELVNVSLLEAGRCAGMADDQIPSHYSARHFFRSCALEAGLPFDAINALMGHQVTGRERYNPFLPHPLAGWEIQEAGSGSDPLLEMGRRLAPEILGRLGGCLKDLEGVTCGEE